MIGGATIIVPRRWPDGWRPAWDVKTPGERVPRLLELGNWLRELRRTLRSAVVHAHPSLQVDPPEVGETAILLHVAEGGPEGLRPIRFTLTLSEGDVHEIVGWQPVRPSLAPSGLVLVQPSSNPVVL